MAVKPFISIDLGTLRDTINKTREGMQATAAQITAAMTKALKQYGDEFMLGAWEAAPVGEGGLRRSRQIEDPEVSDNGALAVLTCGFNIEYAHFRDVGGTIRPVRAGALFIPLRKGVRPVKGKAAQKASGLKQGIDFALAQEVTQEGSFYWTKAVRQAKAEAARKIGQATRNLLRRG